MKHLEYKNGVKWANLQSQVKYGTVPGLKLQPNFVEWMMGYPQGWTDLNLPKPDTAEKG